MDSQPTPEDVGQVVVSRIREPRRVLVACAAVALLAAIVVTVIRGTGVDENGEAGLTSEGFLGMLVAICGLVILVREWTHRNNLLVIGERGIYQRDCSVTWYIPWSRVVSLATEEATRGMAYYSDHLLVLENGETVRLDKPDDECINAILAYIPVDADE